MQPNQNSSGANTGIKSANAERETGNQSNRSEVPQKPGAERSAQNETANSSNNKKNNAA